MIIIWGWIMERNFSEEKAICTHLGDDYDKFLGAVVPPIFQNSLFVFKSFEDISRAFSSEREHYLYTRGTNPTAEVFERKLAALENGESCKCFSSGMAAITASIDAFTAQGDHILFVNNIYGPALQYANYIKKYGIDHDVLLQGGIDSIEKAIKPNTKVLYLESPGTMTFKMLDLPEIAKLSREKGITTIIDNTWATPLFQKPLDMGIDVVVHSCTKYIGGHSDVVAGAIISSKKIVDKIFYSEYQLHGGSLGPFEAWALTRGLRTLPIRMEKHEKNALKVAEVLETNEKVSKVNYPALKSNSCYELGKKQLKGYSGLLSFEIKSNNFEDVKKVVNSCKLFKIGVSWGGYESLILPASHGGDEEILNKKGISAMLIRISVGLEDADLLINDLDNALKSIG